ncbi:unnamed protein product [Peronospora farinosa]|uniref:Uncharacterized protein n=1 Tax=Peronospora farinosa TaxID=134698 RepID=A0AAV0V0Y7_9STRA|nr:unnamed protein product [Peronospora farinosa]CAI5740499.1 unnamed protein product [Peronospora farinosa]
MDEPDGRSGDPPHGGGLVPATKDGDTGNGIMRDDQVGGVKNSVTPRGRDLRSADAHESGKPATGSGAKILRKPTKEGRKLEYEEGHAGSAGTVYCESGQQESTARSQEEEGAAENCSSNRAHSVPQPLGPEELYSSLVHEIKEAPDAALREAWQVTVAYLFSDVYNSIPARRERLSPQKVRYPKLKQAERRLLTSFFEEACVKANCSYQQWEQYATSISTDLLNTAWMLTTILERMLSKLRWSQQPALS